MWPFPIPRGLCFISVLFVQVKLCSTMERETAQILKIWMAVFSSWLCSLLRFSKVMAGAQKRDSRKKNEQPELWHIPPVSIGGCRDWQPRNPLLGVPSRPSPAPKPLSHCGRTQCWRDPRQRLLTKSERSCQERLGAGKKKTALGRTGN